MRITAIDIGGECSWFFALLALNDTLALSIERSIIMTCIPRFTVHRLLKVSFILLSRFVKGQGRCGKTHLHQW